MSQVTFTYKGRNAEGVEARGVVEAASKEDALQKLKLLEAQGLRDIVIESARQDGIAQGTSKPVVKYSSAWNSMLSPDESLIHEFTIGKLYRYVHAGFWGIVLCAFFIACGAWWGSLYVLAGLWLYFEVYLKAAHRYAFTSKRVIVRRGWLSTKMFAFDYGQITGVVVRENFLEKILLRTGTLAIDTAGTDRVEVVLQHVERPYELQKKLNAMRSK